MRKTRCLSVRAPTESSFRPIIVVLAAFATAIILAVSVAPARAEEKAKSKRPSVEVDLSVLDELPPAKPGSGGARITLRPLRAAAKPEPKLSPTDADQARRAAPKPVAKARPAPPMPIIKATPAAPKPVAKARPAPPTPIIKATPTAPEPVAKASPAPPVPIIKAPPTASKPVAKASPAPPKPVIKAVPKTAAKDEARKAAPAKKSSPPAAAHDVAKLGVEKPITIAFEAGSGSLPKPPPEGLDTLVRQMAADDALRIVIYAYAKGAADSSSKARRLSFSRALAVRRYLVGKGVRGTRAEIRALGNKTTKEPADRVDLVLVKR